MGKWQQQMVPIREMTDVLKVVKEVVAIKPKQYVRLKRGIYKDDLAQVGSVYTDCTTIKLLLHNSHGYFLYRWIMCTQPGIKSL